MKRSEFLQRAEFLFQCDQAQLLATAMGLTDDEPAPAKEPTPGTDAWRLAGHQEELAKLRVALREMRDERDEAKATAAQLTVRVADLEDRVSAEGDADNRIRNLIDDVDRRIAEAVRLEREACAEIANKRVFDSVGNNILREIRARGTAPGKVE